MKWLPFFLRIPILHNYTDSTYLALTSEQRCELVEAIKVVDGAPMVHELSKAIDRQLRNVVLPEQRTAFRHQLEGWWLDRAIRSLLNEKEKVISRYELEIELQRICDGYKPANLPLYEEILREISHQFSTKEPPPTYIRQLELLQLSETSKKTAQRDFYQASEHRSRWLREHLLGVKEFPNFDRELTDEWKRRYDFMLEDLPQMANEEEKRKAGKNLYRWASLEANIRMPSRPEWLHQFLTRGSYHMLADKLEVGWMPYYNKYRYLSKNVVQVGGEVES